jgi:hypothetical protein
LAAEVRVGDGVGLLTLTNIAIGQFEVAIFGRQEAVVLVLLKVHFAVEGREVKVFNAFRAFGRAKHSRSRLKVRLAQASVHVERRFLRGIFLDV